VNGGQEESVWNPSPQRVQVLARTVSDGSPCASGRDWEDTKCCVSLSCVKLVGGTRRGGGQSLKLLLLMLGEQST
jgi:hypothetical protein